ncbi:hypothetical protein DFQ30_000964, partial [Apophysomyces sp. BC1015]
MEQEDIMEGMIRKKKQKQRSSEPEGGEQMNVVASDLLTKEEHDDVFLPGMLRSVGTHIKQEALALYPKFFDLNDDQKSVVRHVYHSVLRDRLNSILNLTKPHPKGQAAFFSASRWKLLLQKYPGHSAVGHDLDVPNDFEATLDKIEEVSKSGNIIAALSRAKDAETGARRRDEKFALYLYIHALELLSDHSYLFDDRIDKSEDDFIVKCWGPVMEHLMAGSSIRCKWGDTICSLHSDRFKIDLRVVKDVRSQEHDVARAEFAKKNASPQKLADDHAKVMVEAKQILDLIYTKYASSQIVRNAQIHGLTAHFYDLALEANGLYVATIAGEHPWPVSCQDLGTLRPLFETLVAFRSHTLCLKELVEGAEREAERAGNNKTKMHKRSHLSAKTTEKPIKGSWRQGGPYRPGKKWRLDCDEVEADDGGSCAQNMLSALQDFKDYKT